MRDDTHDQVRDGERRATEPGSERRAARRAGATVSIPPRTAGPAAFTGTTLQARLALLRPQPLRVRPHQM